MEKVALAVKTRLATGRQVKGLRRSGMVPGVVYSSKTEPLLVEMPDNIFARAYDDAGESTIVDLKVDGQAGTPVLIKDVQLDPVTDRISHVDFIRVDMAKKIEATIPLVITGVSPCVKDNGGILVTSQDELNVECLPADLVSEIMVDISGLKEFGDDIKVSGLKIPAGIEVLDEQDALVVQVVEPEEEEVETAAPAAPEAPELVGVEKKEGEEAGEAAPAGGDGKDKAAAKGEEAGDKAAKAKQDKK